MKLNPYLTFGDNCEEAMNFYANCLNGKIETIQRFGEAPMNVPEERKNKVLHCVLRFGGDCIIMASDSMNPVSSDKANTVSLSLDFDSLDEINYAFAKLSEGGKITMPLENTFWNARFGMCTDKYGISWMFNHDLPKE
jgi:PhnB protein